MHATIGGRDLRATAYGPRAALAARVVRPRCGRSGRRLVHRAHSVHGVRAKLPAPFSLAAAGAAGPRRAVRGAVSSAAPARGPDHRRRRRRAARGPSRPGKPYGRDTGRQLPYAAGRRLGRHGGGRAADGRVDGLRAGPRVQAAARARPRRRFRRLSGRHRHGRGVQRPVLRPRWGSWHVRAGAPCASTARCCGMRPPCWQPPSSPTPSPAPSASATISRGWRCPAFRGPSPRTACWWACAAPWAARCSPPVCARCAARGAAGQRLVRSRWWPWAALRSRVSCWHAAGRRSRARAWAFCAGRLREAPLRPTSP